jgi:DNA-binding NarL/FixJ family response regulator
MNVTIVVANEYELVRKGISLLFREEPDCQVVAECSNCEDLLELVSSYHPSVAIAAESIFRSEGFKTARQIRLLSPETRVIILSDKADEVLMHRLLDEGISGYVLRTGPATELLEAVRQGKSTEAYFSPAVSELMRNLESSRQDPLSPRQSEVLKLIAEGYSSKRIAKTLGISESTVKSHRKNIMERLEIHDKVALTRYALRVGLIPSN